MFEQVLINITPIDNEALKASPIPSAGAKLPVFAVPSIPNFSVDVVSISLVCEGVLVVDATDPITASLVFHDKSAAADTTLLTGTAGNPGDFKAAGGLTVKECKTLWTGSQRLDAGDSILAPLTITTPDTAGDGYAWVIAYKVKEYSGQ